MALWWQGFIPSVRETVILQEILQTQCNL